MRRRLRFVGLLGGALLALLRLAGQPRSFESLWAEIYKSAWAGIYTNDQAARGESFYNARCASCHGTSLEGSGEGPPLTGRDFAEDWNCANIADLFEKIQFTMPTDR
ncbi:MAG: cytochrome c, partial [Acidobacteriia bacterium]|nr:cytochrome c [Terriglobia bacterium]